LGLGSSSAAAAPRRPRRAGAGALLRPRAPRAGGSSSAACHRRSRPSGLSAAHKRGCQQRKCHLVQSGPTHSLSQGRPCAEEAAMQRALCCCAAWVGRAHRKLGGWWSWPMSAAAHSRHGRRTQLTRRFLHTAPCKRSNFCALEPEAVLQIAYANNQSLRRAETCRRGLGRALPRWKSAASGLAGAGSSSGSGARRRCVPRPPNRPFLGAVFSSSCAQQEPADMLRAHAMRR